MSDCTEREFGCPCTDTRARANEGTVSFMALVDLFVTCVNDAEANAIRSALLNERLIACGNTWPISSAFRWNDELEEVSEVMLLAKTTDDRQAAAVEVINELHSYDLPAISVVRVDATSPEYERWVVECTRP